MHTADAPPLPAPRPHDRQPPLAAGLVELAPNADHRRSQLVRLTTLGQARYEAIYGKQAVWVNQLIDGLRSLAVRPRHRAYLEELKAKGKLIAAGPWTDDSGALLIYDVADEG